jgi:hypothetical protein
MSEAYEELIQGGRAFRRPPGARHELICARLHALVRASVADFQGANLLEIRAAVPISHDTMLRPDIALVTAANRKLWLAVEVVSSDDHHMDTVVKKQIYEGIKLPRLWMVDPRYDNVEVYHGTQHGMMLKDMFAGQEVLTEKLMPEFQLIVADLFSAASATNPELPQ